jgi:ribosomal protein S18 acetylase RimI-like enzyme
MKELKIRDAMVGDWNNIQKIFNSWKPDNWDLKLAKPYYDRFFRNRNSTQDRVIVGMVNDKVVSVIGICPERLKNNKIYWLGWFYTHKRYVGKSIGRELLNFVVEQLIEKKAKKLFVNTTSDEFYKPALNFYLRNGFELEGKLKNYYEDGEDQLILGKLLPKVSQMQPFYE